MHTRRRFLGAAALGLLGGSLSFAGRAQGPDTAKIIVGFPPGGTTDVMARKVADKLRGIYARVVIVENRPGAGGQLGVVVLKDSPADGATMLLTPSSMLTIYPNTYRTLQYELDDVAPVSLAMYTHHVLSVGPAVPDSVKSLKEFFAWARANPDKAAYGSPGAGSMPHLIGVLVAKASGTELRHVAYRGSAPGIQDLLGGQIASFMPARTGADIVQRAAAALEQAIKQPDVVEFGRLFGLEVQASTPRALGELLKADAAEWSGLAKQTGFTAESG